jgi:hypothetical protein
MASEKEKDLKGFGHLIGGGTKESQKKEIKRRKKKKNKQAEKGKSTVSKILGIFK